MTNNLKSVLLFASAIAVAITASPASAQIPGLNEITNLGKDGVDFVNDKSNAATDKIAKGVGYADFAAAKAKGYANTEILENASAEAKAYKWKDLAAADTASAAMGFKNYAERMAADSFGGIPNGPKLKALGIPINRINVFPTPRQTIEGIRTKAFRTYDREFQAAANKYEAARKTLGPVILKTSSLANYVANTCKTSATGNWGKITPFVNKATKFDNEMQDAVFRVLHTLARGSKPDHQTAMDMLAVGRALGMVSANGFALVGNAYQSNFSISVGGSGGWVAGVNSSVSLAMDTFPTNGKYGMAITVSTGVQVAAGTSALAPGASFGFGLGWGPGSAAGAEGQTLTAGGEVSGIDVAAQWTLPPSLVQLLAVDAARNDFSVNSLTDALTSTVTDSITTMCQAPGISAGVSLPSSENLGNVTFSPGYTTVVWKGSV